MKIAARLHLDADINDCLSWDTEHCVIKVEQVWFEEGGMFATYYEGDVIVTIVCREITRDKYMEAAKQLLENGYAVLTEYQFVDEDVCNESHAEDAREDISEDNSKELDVETKINPGNRSIRRAVFFKIISLAILYVGVGYECFLIWNIFKTIRDNSYIVISFTVVGLLTIMVTSIIVNSIRNNLGGN